MKQFIQRILFGYRPNPKAYVPKAGSILTQPGHNAEVIHSALVLLKFQIKQQLK